MLYVCLGFFLNRELDFFLVQSRKKNSIRSLLFKVSFICMFLVAIQTEVNVYLIQSVFYDLQL